MVQKKLTITFLGTGTSHGVPMIGCNCRVCKSANTKDKRLRSSILVQSEHTTVVIDTTPDFRQQMLRENICHLDAVLLTHPHKDHLGGLDDTRAFQFRQKHSTAIYGNRLSLDGVKQELPYAFKDGAYPGVPVLDLHQIDLSPFTIGDIYIIPILVWHLNMPVYGYRFGPFVYITDANKIDPEEFKKFVNCDTLVLNALRIEPHISHFTLSEAIDVAEKSGANQTFFTHISHQLGLHDEVNQQLAPGMQLAYDGLQLEFVFGEN